MEAHEVDKNKFKLLPPFPGSVKIFCMPQYDIFNDLRDTLVSASGMVETPRLTDEGRLVNVSALAYRRELG